MRQLVPMLLLFAACGGDDTTAAPDASTPDADVSAGAPIFLNRAGGMYTMGSLEDSRTNTSTIITADHEFAAWDATDQEWDALVACVAGMYAPFHVEITDVDPGTTPHIEAMLTAAADWPTVINQAGVGGLSPFSCGLIPNAIVWVNPELSGTPFDQCWTTAQMIGNAAGLDHSFHCPDVMTYLSTCGDNKSFVDMDVSCGEDAARNGCTGQATQNSSQQLVDVFGAAP